MFQLSQNSVPGMYYPGNSLLHQLQARTKIVMLCWLVLWLTLANQLKWHLEPYIVAPLLLCAGVFAAGISLRELWQRMWLLILFSILGFWPILTSTEGTYKTLYTIGPFATTYGIAQTTLLAISMLGILLLLSLVMSRWSFAGPLRRLWQQKWLNRYRLLIIVGTVAALVGLWLLEGIPAGKPLLVGPAKITDKGLWSVITFTSFLLLLYSFSLLMTLTTSPVALIEGTTIILGPLRRVGLPVDSFALMALLALRFIPTLLEETEQLYKAQMARGADITQGTIRERLGSLLILFVPLIRAVLRQASELATALEARGYQSDERQTRLHETTFGWRDYLVLAIVGIMTVGSLLL